MEIGISTASLCANCETENALESVSRFGVDICEVDLQTYYEYRPEFAEKYAGQAGSVKIYSVGAGSGNFQSQLLSPSRRIRGDGFYWLDQVMRSAQIFGAKNYNYIGNIFFSDELCKDLSYVAERISETVAFCARYGVRLCIKNSARGLYDRPGIFAELKSRGAAICGAFNLEQAIRSGYPYPMYLKDMSGAISHVYISDRDENGKNCLPGRGVYDFKEIFTRLKDAGFDGVVIIESNNINGVSEFRNSIDFLNEMIYAGK